jgi:creatinine amidohydrolase/Fe(II)-dependent formamide hydrolase-like protein
MSETRSPRLAHLTWSAVREGRYQVAVLPWGATEAHNTHLPYGTDNIQTEAIALKAAHLATQARRPSCCAMWPTAWPAPGWRSWSS